MDTVSSISSGLTNIIKDSLGLAFVIISYPFLYEHLAVTEIKATWLVWLVAFIVIDFAGYWNHRLNHKINIFWNQHVIHHSSEEFNLACALRQPISNLIGYFSILLIPAAIFGVPYKVIAILAPIHLFAQFWYHTRHIGKMGWLEYVIVTPSQHRVHHAINPEYIDKNLGQILSIWDRIFGTYQEELNDVPPQYGVLKPVGTWNPVYINFQHLGRPSDVKDKFPIKIIEDVYDFKRYEPNTSKALQVYAVFQVLFSVLLLLFMFYNYSDIGFYGLLQFGAFVFFGIFGYSMLIDGDKNAVFVEVFRGTAGIVFIVISGDWFGLNQYVAGYFFITVLCAIYFNYLDTGSVVNNKVLQ